MFNVQCSVHAGQSAACSDCNGAPSAASVGKERKRGNQRQRRCCSKAKSDVRADMVNENETGSTTDKERHSDESGRHTHAGVNATRALKSVS